MQRELGFLGAGRTKAEAQTALDNAKQALFSVRAAAFMFPVSAGNQRAWDAIGPLESGLQSVRDSFEKAPPLITFWGDYVDKANSYIANFQSLEGSIRSMATATGESAQAVPPDVNGPGGPGGGTDAVPWGMLGVIAALGIALWFAVPKTPAVASRSNG
jgi:hypothetical protein